MKTLWQWSPRGRKIFGVVFTLMMLGLMYFMVRSQAKYDVALAAINVHFERFKQGQALTEEIVPSAKRRAQMTKLFKGAKFIAISRVKTADNRQCVRASAKTDAKNGTMFWVLLAREEAAAKYKVIDLSRWHPCVCDARTGQIK